MFLKIFNRFYTLLWKWRFGTFGPGSRVNFPATVNFAKNIRLGEKVWIREHSWLNCDGRLDNNPRLTVGDKTSIGRFVHINAYSSVIVEDSVLISDRVFITDVHHESRDSKIPIIEQGVTHPRPVRLKRGCWIGVGASIMPGVTIGRNSVVAAHAVVTQDLPDNMVARGIPAKNYPKQVTQ